MLVCFLCTQGELESVKGMGTGATAQEAANVAAQQLLHACGMCRQVAQEVSTATAALLVSC